MIASLPNKANASATTGIKWTHLADMYGPTSDESNNNQKALFQNSFSFKSLLKIGFEAFERKTVAALQRKNHR